VVSSLNKFVDNSKIQEITVQCHESELNCIAISYDGKIFATASKKGTLIRLFETATGKKIKELRRGADSVSILSIAFSTSSRLLACTSDKGTVHIFNISDEAHNTKSALNFMGKLGMGYFKSEWSFAQLRISDSVSYCGFGPEDNILVGKKISSYYHERRLLLC
jgi:WD40 repeat protein